ncbi:oligopeptide transport system ATP-binding protein [Paraburkholderia bannensis]|uniref:Oligopeptide transport system ATP-binding protein n=1 Tax=Paraburkholderia bannensis TaxID=765414 RepID=A0A7W9U3V7_9BURK|nr:MULTISPECIES: ABC transporter ATP-binding protein [Paraburkholderia]MBB3260866.1 oligopeptide transport system ATP-binding protein [Paraburkholderia sp. WP4_3_2]MBB6105771.1 oligopeptide transport system ATP-binding protein [Paraburkholderia bannensis]
MALLEVENLGVRFTRRDGPHVDVVQDVSFALDAGGTLGIVGESGSGKSQTVMALLGLLASNGQSSGHARLRGEDLLAMKPAALNRIRGDRIAMIFQDPMTSLNPFLTIERQMTEALQQHRGVTRQEARNRAIEALERVRIPDAARRIGRYPHEFSGGMRQRVLIAAALMMEPDVLIADEPTTALDVTVQAQILALLREMNRERGTAILLITHDMGVVAELCDDVMVMYASRAVEKARTAALFARPQHPYTAGLLGALPRLDAPVGATLSTIPGNPPMAGARTAGCAFAPRCAYAFERCHIQAPVLQAEGTRSRACHLPADIALQTASGVFA